MKACRPILLLCLIFLPLLEAAAQTPAPAPTTNPRGRARRAQATTNDAANPTADPNAMSPGDVRTNQLRALQSQFVPTDPWRILNDKTNFARGTDWVQFEGVVKQISTAGLVLDGWFDEPLIYTLRGHANPPVVSFVVTNFPRAVLVGQPLSRNDKLMAFKSGTVGELPRLDCGRVFVPVLTEEQKAKAALAKTQGAARTLAFQQELADKGDPYGQYKMGLRYLKGDGVTQDAEKGKDLLAKSAAQGNQDASDELAKLTPPK